ncbi:MAG TPA: phage holin family protein [Candidatus Saccharimonadia bacterium]|nr:phage holin family protein [Candidatus Saccharimonadia bacterium]
MDLNSSLSELLHNLDATSYFFVSSGVFVGIVALVFFILGLWFGGLLWRGYKRRYRAAEATIESLKNEAAQLKRCIAGNTARPQAGSSSLGLTETVISPTEMEPVESAPLIPLGQPFTLWTLPEAPAPEPPPASRAFTVWTEPPAPKSMRIADLLSAGSEPAAPAAAAFTAPLLFPSQPPAHPASQAFSIWTEESWAPTPAPVPLLFASPSAAFTVWTSEDYQPPQVPQAWPASAAFTLWTLGDFIPPLASAPVAPPALPLSRDAMVAAAATAVRSIAGRAHPIEPQVIVSFPENSFFSVPRSRAFTLWTLPAGASPSSGISQRNALASLIRSRVEPPPLPALPPLEVEPLPFVPAIELSPRAQ